MEGRASPVGLLALKLCLRVGENAPSCTPHDGSLIGKDSEAVPFHIRSPVLVLALDSPAHWCPFWEAVPDILNALFITGGRPDHLQEVSAPHSIC